MIFSVYSIFTYIHDTENSQERLSLQTLLIHSASFGLFLLSTVLIAVSYGIYVFNSDSKSFNLWSNIVYYSLSFVSQCLLCAIFWVVSSKPIQEESQEDSYAEMKVEEYDEDADL